MKPKNFSDNLNEFKAFKRNLNFIPLNYLIIYGFGIETEFHSLPIIVPVSYFIDKDIIIKFDYKVYSTHQFNIRFNSSTIQFNFSFSGFFPNISTNILYGFI